MEQMHSPSLVVRLFGHPEIALDGAPVSLERHKSIALLAYVAVTGERLGRDTLAALFWPDYEGSEANAYLRRTLWELRKALGEDCLEIDRQTVALPHGDGVWVDVVRFQELAESARAATAEPGRRLRLVQEAADLYRGDFLAGFSLRDSPDFDNWQSLQAEALRHQLVDALALLVEDLCEQGDYEAALGAARRWLALDTLDEAAHRALMRLYADNGQRAAAIHQYEACASTLRDELDAEPEPQTTALYEAIRNGKAGRPRRRPLRAPAAGPRSDPSLPADSIPFIGREAELAQVGRLLADPGCRLLTVVGPGGVGKTRLAVQAARAFAAPFPDGVVYVSLAEQSSGDGLIAAIAEHFRSSVRSDGLTPGGRGEAQRELVEGLGRRAVLLVLDSAEHLIAPLADLLAELLPAAPRLKLLVTSRERLRLPEEWVLELHGLPYPEDGEEGSLAEYPAVQLFVRAARRVRVGLSLGPEDWEAVARICRLVEGLPLGITLAAPWVRMLSCPEIAAEIESGQSLLASSERGVPERHRSLGAVFEQSWQLLSVREQGVLARLSVFEGGFTREAAARVSGASLADLAALVDKSLVRREGSGRYALHQILREHAAEKLRLSEEATLDAEARHAAYYLDWLSSAGEGLRGPEQRQVLAQFAGEAGNLRLAWKRALAQGDWARVRRALPVWALSVEMGTRRAEGAETVDAAIVAVRAALAREEPGEALHAILALLLALRRFLNMSLRPDLPPGPFVTESLALARSLPDCPEKAFVYLLNSIGPALPTAMEGVALAQESQALFEALGDPWGMATARLVWADSLALGAGDVEPAAPIYQDARARFQAMGNRWGEALCLYGLTVIAQHNKRHDQALALASEMVAIYRELGNPWRVMEALYLAYQAAVALGDRACIRACLEDSLAPLEQAGRPPDLARTLTTLGDLALARGDLPAAQRHLERAVDLYQELDDPQGLEKALRALAALAESATREA